MSQFALNPSSIHAVASSLPARPLVFGMQSDAQFSFTSGTVPAEESSLPAAPSVLGTKFKARFALNSGFMPGGENFLPAELLVFGMQYDAQTSLSKTRRGILRLFGNDKRSKKERQDSGGEAQRPQLDCGEKTQKHY